MKTAESTRSVFQTLPARLQSRGFTLLEVMVALALLSLAIATILQLYSMNLNSIRKAELYTEAILLARSEMDRTLSTSKLEQTSEIDTVEELFQMNKTISVIETEEESTVQTYEITITVNWDGGSFELKTRKSILETSE